MYCPHMSEYAVMIILRDSNASKGHSEGSMVKQAPLPSASNCVINSIKENVLFSEICDLTS